MNYTTTHCLFLTGQDIVSASLTFKLPLHLRKIAPIGRFFCFYLHMSNFMCNFAANFSTDMKTLELPEELIALAESMAKSSHEEWAAKLMAEGWTYGEVRDDVRKTHPCLVPYEELPESEKEYDFNTSIETLKFILTQGFDIVKK